MTDTVMLIPPGWAAVASLALRRGRPDVLSKLREMDLEVAEETYREQYGEPIVEVEGFGPCWAHQPDRYDDYDQDPDATRYYQCSRAACQVRTEHPSAFSGFDPPVPGSPAESDYQARRSYAIAAGLLRADLERLVDLEAADTEQED
jgi:hypothetical protein